METINLIGELRLFAEGNHESSGYLLTRDQAKLLMRELDRLVRAAGAVSDGASFADIIKQNPGVRAKLPEVSGQYTINEELVERVRRSTEDNSRDTCKNG